MRGLLFAVPGAADGLGPAVTAFVTDDGECESFQAVERVPRLTCIRPDERDRMRPMAFELLWRPKRHRFREVDAAGHGLTAGPCLSPATLLSPISIFTLIYLNFCQFIKKTTKSRLSGSVLVYDPSCAVCGIGRGTL